MSTHQHPRHRHRHWQGLARFWGGADPLLPPAAGCQLSPWSLWSPCSASCGGGSSERRRELQGGEEEPCPLPVLRQLRVCNAHNCTPGRAAPAWAPHRGSQGSGGGGICPPPLTPAPTCAPQGVPTARCTGTAPTPAPAPAPTSARGRSACSSPASPAAPALTDRWGRAAAPRGTGDVGLGRGSGLRVPPHPQVLQDGACVPPERCRCVLTPAVPWALNLSKEEQEQEHAPGSLLRHRCNSWWVPPAPQNPPRPTMPGSGWALSRALSPASVSAAPSTAPRRTAVVRELPLSLSPCLCRGPRATAGPCSCVPTPAVDCLWSPWSPWSPCSVTCGAGERLSRRHPLRQRLYEGAECLGPPLRRAPCSLPDCGECPQMSRGGG